MSLNGDHYKEFQEQNFILQDEEKGVNCKFTHEKQRLPENDKLKSNAIVSDVQERKGEAVQLWDVIPERQLQHQESMVCWERFLHLRSLKVLLVENDDSTRHIVCALLRNCSYEVIEAANGLQAWKLLEDLSIHIDLILTEAVMPCFSGIGLLCKIMNHKTRNNIPVIMMSSHDSMGLVFKCLSKGAVDFLVKPVRKNELKILWQHVWRRCHTSSGESETAAQTQKSVKSKNVINIGNNIGSDDQEDNETNLNVEDDTGNGSNNQGSWTKQIVEIETSRDVPECADSTCAQVVHSNENSFGDNVPLPLTREFHEQNNQQDSVAMFDEAMTIPPKNLDSELDLSNEVSIKHVSVKPKNTALEMGINKFNEQLNNGLLKLNSGSITNKLKCEDAALKDLNNDLIVSQMDNSVSNAPNEHLKISDIMSEAASDSDGPSPDLSLKRLRGVKDSQRIVPENQNVTRHSDSTSFSRYNADSNLNQALTVQVESNSPCEIFPDNQSNSRGNPPNQCSNEDSNNVDMGSTTNNAFTMSITTNEYSVVVPTVHGLQVSLESKSIKEDKVSTREQILLDNCDDMATAIVQAQTKDIKSLCDQHVRHLFHRQTLPSEHGDFSLKKMAVTLTHYGSFNLDGPIEGNASNFSVDRSGTGSNPSSDGQNGKIRPKRKERCTQKEVHYQKRKRLFEDHDSGDPRRKFWSKNAKEAEDDYFPHCDKDLI